jgi:hypothetical protein
LGNKIDRKHDTLGVTGTVLSVEIFKFEKGAK